MDIGVFIFIFGMRERILTKIRLVVADVKKDSLATMRRAGRFKRYDRASGEVLLCGSQSVLARFYKTEQNHNRGKNNGGRSKPYSMYYFSKPKELAYIYDDCSLRQGSKNWKDGGFTAIPVINSNIDH